MGLKLVQTVCDHLNSKLVRSKAKFWEIVCALFLLLLVQLDLGDLRLQIGEFCIEAACVPISSQIRNKRGFHFSLQKIMLNLPDYFLQVTNASIIYFDKLWTIFSTCSRSSQLVFAK